MPIAFVFRMARSNPTAADIMSSDVATASPKWTLSELERQLCAKKVSGFPVVERDRLVGVVSRSDVVRQLTVERSRAGSISDYFRRDDADEAEIEQSELDAERFVGTRFATLRVSDVMSPPTFVAAPDMTIREVAQLLVENRIHRVPVVAADDRLVGLVSSLELVRLIALGKLEP